MIHTHAFKRLETMPAVQIIVIVYLLNVIGFRGLLKFSLFRRGPVAFRRIEWWS